MTLFCGYQRFRRAYCLHQPSITVLHPDDGSSIFLRIVGTHIPDCIPLKITVQLHLIVVSGTCLLADLPAQVMMAESQVGYTSDSALRLSINASGRYLVTFPLRVRPCGSVIFINFIHGFPEFLRTNFGTQVP
jgi:hypothetical protein